MIVFLTILAFLFLIALIVIDLAGVIKKEPSKDRYGDVIPASPGWLVKTTTKQFRMSLGILLVVLFLIGESVVFTREGNQYYVLSPTGERSAIMTPGIKFVTPFSTVEEWSKYIDIRAVKLDSAGNYAENVDGVEGIIPGGVTVRFIDRATAQVYISIRFELPNDAESFIKLKETYKTSQNLVNSVLLPTISEQLGNVSYMYSADEYVSGAASDYKATVEDALKNGGFVVQREEVQDTIYAPEVLSVDSLVSKPRKIQEIRKLERNSKVLVNGVPKRVPHEISTNKVITASVIIGDVIPEKSFMDKLREQRDLSAQKIIEIQRIETAAAAQQRIIAEGERDKAAERVEQEKAQVSKLINIETQVKEEESKRQLAEIAVQTAELEAKATLTRERANAEANRLKVAAGLSPQERALWDYRRDSVTSANLSKMSTPQIVIMGADGKGSDLTNSLIQAEMAKKLLNKN